MNHYVPQEKLFDQGKIITLARSGVPAKDGIYTASDIVREWALVVQPTVDTLVKLNAVGVQWNVLMTVNSGYVSTSGLRINRPVTTESGFETPVAGTVIPVHGEFIQADFTRLVPDAAPQVDVELLLYGLPGAPRKWSWPTVGIISAGGIVIVPVRTLAWAYSISGALAGGDTIDQLTPNGTVIQAGVPVTQNFANWYQPIHPDCGNLRYNSADIGKRLLFHFWFRI